jgi:hypothetical protein
VVSDWIVTVDNGESVAESSTDGGDHLLGLAAECTIVVGEHDQLNVGIVYPSGHPMVCELSQRHSE